jgi:hypothetical protein
MVPDRECSTPTLMVQSCAAAPEPAAISVVTDSVDKRFFDNFKDTSPIDVNLRVAPKCRLCVAQSSWYSDYRSLLLQPCEGCFLPRSRPRVALIASILKARVTSAASAVFATAAFIFEMDALDMLALAPL